MLVDEDGGTREAGEMGEETRTGGAAEATKTKTSGRARQSDRARRKRELRDRISELKSKRSKIGKKNFGKSEERKRLTMMIKELERERVLVATGVIKIEILYRLRRNVILPRRVLDA